MKNAPVVLSSLSLLGVIVLFILHFSGNKPGAAGAGKTPVAATPANAAPLTGRIVYVDIDTFNEKFTYLKEKREAFVKRTEAMQRELQQAGQQMGRDYQELQKKASAGTLTEAEGKAGEARLMQQEQSLKTRENTMSQQLAKEQDEFNSDLHKRLDAFLQEYNNEKGYDYIFYYTSGAGAMLFANKKLDVTTEVLNAVNAEFGSAKTTKEAEKK